jgi:hypothetical protein
VLSTLPVNPMRGTGSMEGGGGGLNAHLEDEEEEKKK